MERRQSQDGAVSEILKKVAFPKPPPAERRMKRPAGERHCGGDQEHRSAEVPRRGSARRDVRQIREQQRGAERQQSPSQHEKRQRKQKQERDDRIEKGVTLVAQVQRGERQR